jgi:hypothetical protein
LQQPLLVARDARASADPSLRPSACQTRQSPFAQPYSLLFCDDGQDADDGIPKHPAGVEVLFTEAAVPDAVPSQRLEVPESFEDALAAEPVQAPEQHRVELSA